MRHRTRPVPVSSRGPEGAAGATSGVALKKLAKPVFVSRGERKNFRTTGKPGELLCAGHSPAHTCPLLVSPGPAGEPFRAAPSLAPSGILRPGISSRSFHLSRDSRRPFRMLPRASSRPPAPCRRPAVGVPLLFRRPRSSPFHVSAPLLSFIGKSGLPLGRLMTGWRTPSSVFGGS